MAAQICGNTSGGADEGRLQLKGRKASNCLSSFQNSTFGKVNNFFSAINGIVNFKEAWPDWTVLPGVKVAAAYAVAKTSSFAGDIEFLSITGGKSTIVKAPTAAMIEGAESSSAGTLGLVIVPFATAIDAGVRNTCSQLPDLTFSFSLPSAP